MILVPAAVKIIKTYVITPIKGTVNTLQESSEKLNGVAGEVLKRTRTRAEAQKGFPLLRILCPRRS